MRRFSLAALLASALSIAALGTTAAAEPTCSDVTALNIQVHGQHVVRDYVTGGELGSWPPAGGAVGDAVAGDGAAVPGGPGPGFHFPNLLAPGASTCNDSNSPGIHL